MTWVKLDDGFAQHPKLLALLPEARWSHISGLCWSARNQTDGFIPAYVLPVLQCTPEHVSALEGVRLWEPTEGGWVIHDFLEYNPSRAQVAAEQKRKRDAANERWHPENARRNAPPNAESNAASNAASNADSIGKSAESAHARPVPSPSSLREEARPSPVRASARAEPGGLSKNGVTAAGSAREEEADPGTMLFAVQVWEEKMGTKLRSPAKKRELAFALDAYGTAAFLDALDEAKAEGGNTPGYVVTIMKRWSLEGRDPPPPPAPCIDSGMDFEDLFGLPARQRQWDRERPDMSDEEAAEHPRPTE